MTKNQLRKRPVFSFTIDPELLSRVDALVDKNEFRSRSDAIERALKKYLIKEKPEQSSGPIPMGLEELG